MPDDDHRLRGRNLNGKDYARKMTDSELKQPDQQFLIRLFEQTQGDPSIQVSMYEIGKMLGLDREASCRAAEELMGSQLVEIRTLSGGIGISAAGSERAKNMIGLTTAGDGEFLKLGDRRILSSEGCRSVQQIVLDLKNQAGNLGLDFETLTELMADLKTIDAQLASSRPKTAIVRESLRSIQDVIQTTDAGAISDRIQALLDH